MVMWSLNFLYFIYFQYLNWKFYTVLSGVVYAVHIFFCLFLTYAQKSM